MNAILKRAKAIAAALITSAGAICVAAGVDPKWTAIVTAICASLAVHTVPNAKNTP